MNCDSAYSHILSNYEVNLFGRLPNFSDVFTICHVTMLNNHCVKSRAKDRVSVVNRFPVTFRKRGRENVFHRRKPTNHSDGKCETINERCDLCAKCN